MVWSEYTSATHGEEADIDEEVDARAIPYNRELDYDDWTFWFSDDMHNLWWNVRDYLSSRGNTPRVLDQADFEDFSRFCYNFSCKLRSHVPS